MRCLETCTGDTKWFTNTNRILGATCITFPNSTQMADLLGSTSDRHHADTLISVRRRPEAAPPSGQSITSYRDNKGKRKTKQNKTNKKPDINRRERITMD